MTAKKTQPKPQPQLKEEPPAEEPHYEPYHPMAVTEPTTGEVIEALTIRIKVLEEQVIQIESRVSQHNRYHFGKST